MTDQAELLPGTLDLLILKAVSLGRLHGYGLLLRIGQISGGALRIQQGALYPALYRLEHQGLIITSALSPTPTNVEYQYGFEAYDVVHVDDSHSDVYMSGGRFASESPP